MSKQKAKVIIKRMGFDSHYVINSNVWKIKILNQDTQFVLLEVRYGLQEPWFFTAVYGSPIPVYRNSLRSFLKRISASISGPQTVMGDFNAILSDSERQGGVARPNSIGMKAFRKVIEWCQLIDVGFKGPKFTWKRGDL